MAIAVAMAVAIAAVSFVSQQMPQQACNYRNQIVGTGAAIRDGAAVRSRAKE